MDNQDFTMRKNLSSMVAPNVPRSIEWVWQGSKTFGSQYQTFTGELYGDGYGGCVVRRAFPFVPGPWRPQPRGSCLKSCCC